jgi:Fe-S cluster biogenesis protein NfuA
MSWLSRILGADSARVPASGDPERVAAVEAVLDELRPMLALDGGDFELVSVEGGIVTLRAKGACVGCHAQAMTLTQALEVRLRERCPWFVELRTAS